MNTKIINESEKKVGKDEQITKRFKLRLCRAKTRCFFRRGLCYFGHSINEILQQFSPELTWKDCEFQMCEFCRKKNKMIFKAVGLRTAGKEVSPYIKAACSECIHSNYFVIPNVIQQRQAPDKSQNIS